MFGDARRTDGYACDSIVGVSVSMGKERIRRPFHRVLKLSRTIADLVGSDTIEVQHPAEPLQYRPRWAV